MMTSKSGQRMLGYLPPLYDNSQVMQSVLDAQGTELDKFWAGVQDILAQYFVQTATWSIDLWEEELGITPDASQAIEDRRGRVLARMRGYGTVTIGLLTHVAEAYQNGRVVVLPDYPASKIVFRFLDAAGIPPNVDSLQAELRRIVPADYDLQFDFRYLSWNDLDAKNLTWDDLDAKNMTWDQLEVWLTTSGGSDGNTALTMSEE